MARLWRQRSNNQNNLIDDISRVLRATVKRHSRLVIGLSGGVDSVVLLDVLTALSKPLAFELSAVHVNHGISGNAAKWGHFCTQLCYSYAIPVSVSYLKIKKTPGMSLEAVAREKRYQIFNRQQADYVLLAHHLDDQAETLLLQLFRGAGVKGLSAMPTVRKQGAGTAPAILRPLLEVSRSSIETYAAQHCLNWIVDESNDSITFNRNFLRHEILPVLGERYPNYAKILRRTSQHMAEAALLLDELAELDARYCVESGKLKIAPMRALSDSRAKNLLRYILRQHHAKLPSAVKLDDILNQLLSAKGDSRLHIVFGYTEIRAYRGAVYISPVRKVPRNDLQYEWQGESVLDLKELGGALRFTFVNGQGLSVQKLTCAPVIIKLRQGGERFMPHCDRPRRSLKNLLQEAAIPPWRRHTLPLLFSGGNLAWVPGIGVDCEFQTMPGEAGIVPEWLQD